MSKNLQLLLQEALNNNSYDYSSMHLELKKTWENSFSYLYGLQKSFIEYEELFYYSDNEINRNSEHIGHLYLDEINRAMFDVDYDLIHVYTREEFRTSSYYQKEIPIQTVIDHPEIFTKIPIIMIDDQVIWDYRLKIEKDSTTIVLPFKRNFVIADKRNPDVSILRRGNQYTVTKDLQVYGTDPSGDVIDLGYTFLPAKVVKIRNVIMDATRQGKTISSLEKEIDQLLFDYYVIDEIDDEKVVFTAVEDDLVYIDHKIQVLVVDNLFYQRYRLTRNNLGLNTVDHSIAILYTLLGDPFNPPIQDGIYMLSFHFPNIYGKDYELGSVLIPGEKRNGYLYATLPKDLCEKLASWELTFFVSIVFVSRLHLHTFYNNWDFTTANEEKETNLFILEEDNLKPFAMPIPIENLMIFKEHGDTGKGELIRNVDSVKMYYPNIYQIIDPKMKPGDTYRIYYFYYKGYDLKYTPVHHFYYQFLDDIFKSPMEQIVNNIFWGNYDLGLYFNNDVNEVDAFEKIYQKILNYQYYHHQYAEIDFLFRYTQEEDNAKKEPVEYKDETMRDWIKVQPFVLMEYVIEQKHRGETFFMFTNTINLAKRLRQDTSFEMDVPTTFEGMRYVFAIANRDIYPRPLNCRVFVDGIFISDVYQERKDFLDYIYIPISDVTEDSFIEIEVFDTYSYETEVTFTSLEDTKEISIVEPDKNISPTIADLVFLDTRDNTTRYDNDFFDIVAHYRRGDFEVEPVSPDKPIRFTRLSNFSIKPNDEMVLNVPFKIRLSKISSGELYKVKEAGIQIFSLVTDGFGFNFEYVRFFVNGRLLPRGRYFINTNYNYPVVYLMDNYDVGDEIYIDVTPYRYKEIYYQAELSPDTTIIDLKDYITKPFNIKYYDVYLNGRKLNLTNAYFVDPWSMTLTNLKSIYNLVIYEKERDYEYFGLNYKEYQYYFSIEELLKQPFISEEERNTIIKRIIESQKDDRTNIYPNTNEEQNIDHTDITQYIRIYSFYHDELIPETNYNPDVKQTTYETMTDLYYPVYNAYHTSPYLCTTDPVDKERRKGYCDVVFIDPDVDLMKHPDGEEYKQLVYLIGHPEEVEQEKLDTPITIDSTKFNITE